MKKIFLPFIILTTLTHMIFSLTPSDELFYHITQYMNSFSTLFPLKEGSSEEREAVRLITDRLNHLNIEYSLYNLSSSENYPSPSVIIDAVFYGRKGDEVFMIFPINPVSYVNPDTAGFNLSEALFLAESLNSADLSNTVHILFMGAEFGGNREYPLGTSEYLRIYYPRQNSAFLYFNISGVPEKLDLFTSGTGSVSPLWLVKKSLETLKDSNLPFVFKQRNNLIYRLGLNDEPSLIDPYFNNSYPVVLFQNNSSGKLNRETAERYHTFLYSFAADPEWELQPEMNWDKHYLIVNTSHKLFYVSEQRYILFLIILFTLILLYPFIATGRFKKYLKTIFSHIWTIPILFLMVFLFLFISTFALKALLQLRGFNSLWEYAPVLMLVFKLAFSSFLFLISLRFFKFFNFSHRGSFYSASAIVFILLDVTAVMAIDISFAFYLVPVLFTVFLFTVVRNRWVKLFFLTASSAILVLAASKMFSSGSGKAVEIFLLSTYGNFLITANLLPVLLMTYRIRFLFHHRNSRSIKRIILAVDLSLGLISISMYIYLALFSPFSQRNPQPLRITETVNIGNSTMQIALESPASLGSFSIVENNVKKEINTKNRKILIETAAPASLPSVTLNKEKFLNRSKFTLSYKYIKPPDSLDISLVSDREIIVYDSNFPYRANLDSSRIDFKTGSFPPSDFILVFTLPGNFNGEILLTAGYLDADGGAEVSDDRFYTEKILIFKKKLLITNSD